MQAIKTETVGPLTVEVHYDQHGDLNDPRDWTNVGVMLTSHRHYELGDIQVRADDIPVGKDAIDDWLVEEYGAIRETIMPLYLFDHSGLSISTDDRMFRMADSAGWDWGMVGVAFATADSIKETVGADASVEDIRAAIVQEVKTYDAYLRGEVYGFVVKDEDDEVLDSCWGFVGEDEDEYALKEGLAVAEHFRPVAQRFVEAGVGL